MKFRKIKLGKYFFDFISVFFAVISAFALSNWNDNRKDDIAEEKILLEIKNGLQLDLLDFKSNKNGHNKGLESVKYFKNILTDKPVNRDSLLLKYFFLTGDNNSVMNVSGFESLKSKGLEIIKNDSIRSQITSIYENDYKILTNYEENSPMYQNFQNYYFPIDNKLEEYFIYDDNGQLNDFKPLKLSLKDKNSLLGYLFRIRVNRVNKLYEYNIVEKKVLKLITEIEQELENR